MDLTRLLSFFRDRACTRLYVKDLAENDNSKNQPYFGPGFQTLNILPNKGVFADTSGTTGGKPNFKAAVNFAWLDEHGGLHEAPHAKLILYPQYPEVRFSGFLLGCRAAPSELMRARAPGATIPERTLFLGVRDDGLIIGYLTLAAGTAVTQFRGAGPFPQVGVFYDATGLLAHAVTDTRVLLLARLRNIHRKGWIDGRRLRSDGTDVPCPHKNCGGFTLEAEFNILPNSASAPDIMGWELKQHNVPTFDNLGTLLLKRTDPITLMTPEPTAGLYKTAGVIKFVKDFGHKHPAIADRMDVTGTHKAGLRSPATGLTLRLNGYDVGSGKITDVKGGLTLVSDKGEEAATWLFSDLITHWERKHSKAAYVPSMRRDMPSAQFKYGHVVRLGEGTDALRFLKAVADGVVYYDPGIHVENLSSAPVTKRRSQFRVKSRDIGHLYTTLMQEDLT